MSSTFFVVMPAKVRASIADEHQLFSVTPAKAGVHGCRGNVASTMDPQAKPEGDGGLLGSNGFTS
jgi:hypothetical protein